MDPLWIALVVGFSVVISGVYFYCTVRHQRCYGDNEVPEIQISG